MFTKLDLIERIIATTDEKVLEKVGKALQEEKGEFAFTKEHWPCWKNAANGDARARDRGTRSPR